MKYRFSSKPGHRGSHSRGVRALGPKKSSKGAGIEISRLINKAVDLPPVAPYEARHTFADFYFSEKLAANLQDKGYKVPTPIQDQAIPAIMAGQDVIGLANTGTGKTAAFLLPIIEEFLQGKRGLALIVAPTRELAMQIKEEAQTFCRGTSIASTVCVGGQSMHQQVKQLTRQPHLVIGTPGRLKDLWQQGHLPLEATGTLVLDEVDRMLDMGFINDIRAIVGATPTKRQSLFFSATMTSQIRTMADSFLNNPTTISVVVSQTSRQVEQDVVYVPSVDAKQDTLEELLRQADVTKAIVFGGTKWGVQKLSRKLEQKGFKVAAIHGDKTQGQRMRALKDFKTDRVQTLIATDVAARGLDIPQVSHVINFDMPQTYEDYTHRIGRTGRAGQTGTALTFVVGRPPVNTSTN